MSGYAAFARGGIAVTPTMLHRPPQTLDMHRHLVSPRTAFWITDILSDPVDPTLHREFQSIHLRATSEAEWRIDGEAVPHEWSLSPGKHVIVATNGVGERDRVMITVR